MTSLPPGVTVSFADLAFALDLRANLVETGDVNYSLADAERMTAAGCVSGPLTRMLDTANNLTEGQRRLVADHRAASQILYSA